MICTMRHMITLPGASFGPLPNCSAIGPLANMLSLIFTCYTPVDFTIRLVPFAVMTNVFHLLPTLGMDMDMDMTLAKSELVVEPCTGSRRWS